MSMLQVSYVNIPTRLSNMADEGTKSCNEQHSFTLFQRTKSDTVVRATCFHLTKPHPVVWYIIIYKHNRSLLNNSGHCLENRTRSRSGVEDTTISANLTTHQIPQMPSFLPVFIITEPGSFQPTLATVRRIAQDPIWRMKSQSHNLKLHHPNR